MLQRSVSLPNLNSEFILQSEIKKNMIAISSISTIAIENMPEKPVMLDMDVIDGIKLKAVRVGFDTPLASVAVEVNNAGKDRSVNVGVKVLGFGACFGMDYEKTSNKNKPNNSYDSTEYNTWL
ncbi:hypothetical protein ACEWAX_21750 [Vibrio parahaemolyticus]|uniref:hypothetical protein n=1 Tax=Vibrio harveyi group TaxID=717610 RepID=UPI0009B6B46E|nr:MULTISPECIES: hypothetical protein [Vibrio harveyi group]AVF62354.1 hypothetical protein AL537_24070 [Vibrio diabolicus]EGR3370733.1 hypothetical protein [Vibrio parahaemolyticus]EGR3406470.1 hypothetical protein [Vibrio parahaemolyticus]EJG1716524.1 hypothetical protein [Vibrio parahaemolyticus]OQK18787.1 hypothetical protein XM69_u0123 [Vibrio parahaemolyticus]